MYSVRQSKRSRSIRMTIDPDEGLVVTVPNAWFERFVEGFLQKKSAWILKHMKRMKKMEGRTVIKISKDEYEKNKNGFLRQIITRVEFFNSLYKFRYSKISVRNQISLWGSCTRAGNLQFNYKLFAVSKEALDYVVVHELCHLQEHNHGPRFWKLVSRVVPDYKTIRKTLHQYVMKEG
jgi:predicted metal-dependent hydrolase